MTPKLTPEIKLEALAAHYYLHGAGAAWEPKAGDLYTVRRSDLELFRIEELLEDGAALVRNLTTDPAAESAPMRIEAFGRDEFHRERVPVPDWLLRAVDEKCTPPTRAQLIGTYKVGPACLVTHGGPGGTAAELASLVQGAVQPVLEGWKAEEGWQVLVRMELERPDPFAG